MMFSKRGRLAVLAIHITTSVGWIGVLLAYLVLDVIAATSDDATTLRTAYTAMHAITIWALIPISTAAWSTGIVLSLGTKWGLLRHWWVVVSLVLTSIAWVVLLIESATIAKFAVVAENGSDLAVAQLSHTLPHSVGGLLVLLAVNVLNILKPRGLTRYGWRKGQESKIR